MRHGLLAAAVSFVFLYSACDDMGAEPSMLDAPRFLAVRATPGALTPGESLTVEALGWQIDGVSWTGCATAFAPTDPPSCPAGPIALGEGNPLTFVAPADVDPLWVRADATSPTGVLPIIRAFASDAPADNPEVTAIEAADGPLPASIAPATEQSVRARLTLVDAETEPIVSYYTSTGSFEPFRLYGEGETTLTAGAAATEATIIAVVRDDAGGTGWLSTTLRVEAP